MSIIWAATKKFGKALLAIELISLGGAFFVFHKVHMLLLPVVCAVFSSVHNITQINTDVEARLKMHQHAPLVIEVSAHELLSHEQIKLQYVVGFVQLGIREGCE
jgi:hypothetical protein